MGGNIMLKLLLVLAYFMLVYLIACLIEYLVSLHPTLFIRSSDTLRRLIVGTKVVEVRSKPVTQLKTVLDQRGVSYYNVVEKKDLYSLIGESGELTEEELEAALSALNSSQTSSPVEGGLQLNSSAHFNELVEDNKDSVWLLRMHTAAGFAGNLTPEMWHRLVRRFARFGVRAGQLDCLQLQRLCENRGFTRADLVLALPRGKDRQKDSVDFRVIPRQHGNSPEKISRWIDNVLAERIPRLTSLNQLASKWTTDNRRPEQPSSQSYIAAMLSPSQPPPPLDMVVFSKAGVRPLVLSALSVKFTGRVHFWWLNVGPSSALLLQDLTRFWAGLDLDHLPSYILFTRDRAYPFGRREGEFLSFRSLDLFLTMAYPEANDVLLVGLLCVNLMALLQTSLKQGSKWTRLFSASCCLVLYNLVYLVLCLPVIGLFSLRITSPVVAFLLDSLRQCSFCQLSAQLRHLTLSGLLSAPFLAVVYLFHALLVARLEYWRTGGRIEEPEEPSASLSALFSAAQRLPNSSTHYDLEAGGDLDLLHSLSQTNLNLPAAGPPAYLAQLVTWKMAEEVTAAEPPSAASSWPPPTAALATSQCVVCLDRLRVGVVLCCLPCGHTFHESCVKTWLLCSRDAGCPTCRWPAYKTKMH